MIKPLAMLGTGLLTIALSLAAPAGLSSAEAAVRKAATMRDVIYKKLNSAQELADQNKYTEALAELQELENRRRNSYETASTYNMFAYVYFNQENYKSAAASWESALKIENLPEALEQTMLYSLAKVYMIQDDYKNALNALNRWFKVMESPGAEPHVLRAQLYYQLEQYKNALPDVKKAIAMAKEGGEKPKENWLMLERAVYYQNGDFKNLARCLQDLAALYPKSQYWVQLAAVYNELGQPLKELSTLETAYDQGMLTQGRDLENLAYALMGQDIPYKAAVILEKAMAEGKVERTERNMSSLGDAWMLAREYDKAIVVMTKAAEMSAKGDDFFKLAQIHAERQEWDLALSSANKALADNNLRNPAKALMLQGHILFNMGELADAKGAFVKASKHEGSEREAGQWIAFVEGEEKRREYMAASN